MSMPRKKAKRYRGTQTIAEIRADAAYWHRIEKYLPWRVMGFTYRSGASFLTRPRSFNHPLAMVAFQMTDQHNTVHLTGTQFDQIMSVLEHPQQEEKR